MRRMGSLRRCLPITPIAILFGTLALIGTPFFSGYYSKDMIIEAVGHADRAGAVFAYWMVLLGVFVTALYSFRLYFLVFWGEERIDPHAREHMSHLPRYAMPVLEWPLVLLAIPSVVIAWFTAELVLFGDYFGEEGFPLTGLIKFGARHIRGERTNALIARAVRKGLLSLNAPRRKLKITKTPPRCIRQTLNWSL
jgi:NADH-quinone oxidoreductase subunit L